MGIKTRLNPDLHGRKQQNRVDDGAATGQRMPTLHAKRRSGIVEIKWGWYLKLTAVWLETVCKVHDVVLKVNPFESFLSFYA